MAFYIELTRIKSQEINYAYYRYEYSIVTEYIKNKAGKCRGISKRIDGTIRIHLKTGDVEVVKIAPGENGMHVNRAALALIKHWKDGDLPEKTYWAS